MFAFAFGKRLANSVVDVDWRNAGVVRSEMCFVLEEAEELSTKDSVVTLPRSESCLLLVLNIVLSVEESLHVDIGCFKSSIGGLT